MVSTRRRRAESIRSCIFPPFTFASFFSNEFCHCGDEVFDGRHAFLECGLFFACEFEFDDLFDAASTEDDGHADVVAADAVFFVAVGGTRD